MASLQEGRINVEEIYEGLVKLMNDKFSQACPICFRYFETTTKEPLRVAMKDAKNVGVTKCRECDEQFPPVKENTSCGQ